MTIQCSKYNFNKKYFENNLLYLKINKINFI